MNQIRADCAFGWLPFLAAGGPLGTALSFCKLASLANNARRAGPQAAGARAGLAFL